jgi:hypothetical protein
MKCCSLGIASLENGCTGMAHFFFFNIWIRNSSSMGSSMGFKEIKIGKFGNNIAFSWGFCMKLQKYAWILTGI